MPDSTPVSGQGSRTLRSRIAVLLCPVFVLAYSIICLAGFLGDIWAERADFRSLQRAARVSPGNAEVHRRLGNLFHLQGQFEDAERELEIAARLNAWDSQTQLDLARTYQILNNPDKQEVALESALRAAPTKPEIAWQAANFFLIRGELEKALRSFRIVLETDRANREAALDLVWRAVPDADRLISDVMPHQPEVYGQLLEQLVSRKESKAAQSVWEGMVRLGQPFQPRPGLAYVNFLIEKHEADAAMKAWQQMGPLCGLSAYLPSANLIVNQHFDEEVLNAGFDWHYITLPNIHLTLDPAEYQRSTHSLLVNFEGPGVNEVGLAQWLALAPNSQYQFSVRFKTDELEGAGGPAFVIRDEGNGSVLLTTDNLRNPGSWREWSGHFPTGPSTNLASLRLLRIPAGNAIRGHLWIDEVELTQISKEEGTTKK